MITGEVKPWQIYWNNRPGGKKISTDTEAFEQIGNILPNSRQLSLILAVLPARTSTSEMYFSTLKRIKSYFRTTMGENHLNGLALLIINNEIIVKSVDLIDSFAKRSPGRLQLP